MTLKEEISELHCAFTYEGKGRVAIIVNPKKSHPVNDENL